LRDDLTGGLVLLELQHVQDAIGVDGEQIDDLPEARRDLAADNEQRLAKDRRFSLDELFKTRLGRHAAGDKPDWLIVYTPQTHLYRHCAPSKLHLKADRTAPETRVHQKEGSCCLVRPLPADADQHCQTTRTNAQ
jgi:hypothetical protein